VVERGRMDYNDYRPHRREQILIDGCDGMAPKETPNESPIAEDGCNNDRAQYTRGM
jgi:hypothetical protein